MGQGMGRRGARQQTDQLASGRGPRPWTWLALAFVLVASCGFTGGRDDWGPDVLVMNAMAEPGALDPAVQTSVEELRISLGLFEGLLAYGPDDLAPVPGVAERTDVSEDGLEWTFHLRACTWSNGDPVTANDFLYSWRRVLTSSPDRMESGQRYHVVARLPELMNVIDGAEVFRTSKDPVPFSTVGIRAIDPRTFFVRLARPTPWFRELLCYATFAPVHPPTVEAHRNAWTRPETFVGNGPFVLVERRLGNFVRVARSDRYWDRDAVGLEGVVYLSTDRLDTALDQYLAGESDWVRRFDPKKVRAWRADPELSRALLAPDYLGTYFYRFNTEHPAFADRRVRQALSLATDRESITRYLTGLGEEPALGIVPPCMREAVPKWEIITAGGLAFDPERARRLLADAGHAGGKGLGVIEIAFNSDLKNRAIAEAIQQMWTRELGVEVSLVNREKKVHLSEERQRRYVVSRGSWVADYTDPFNFLEFLTSGAGSNRTGWSNAEFDRLVRASRDVLDEATRVKMLQEAEAILVAEDPPILPIYHFKSEMVLRPDTFDGIDMNARDLHPPKYIRKRAGH